MLGFYNPVSTRLKASEAALARIEEIGSSSQVRPETVDRIRQLSREASHEDSVRRLYSREFEELAREALDTERETVITLRNDESINDEVLRRIQRDIDLAEARLHHEDDEGDCALKGGFKFVTCKWRLTQPPYTGAKRREFRL